MTDDDISPAAGCSASERPRARGRCLHASSRRRGGARSARAHAPRRRRDRRRRLRRADRGLPAVAAGQVRRRARGAQPRRRPRAEPRPRRRRGCPSAAARSSARPRTGCRRSAQEFGIGTFPTYNEGENIYYADGTGDRASATPARSAALRPTRRSLRDLATRRHPARRDVEGDAGRRSVGARRTPPSSTARPSRSWVRANTTTARTLREARARSPAGRSSAPSRASCRCCSCSSTSPRRATRRTSARSSATSTRATARRSRASSAARRRSASRSPRRSAARSCATRRCGRSATTARRVSVISDRLNVKAKRVIVAVPPVLAGRIDYAPGPAAAARRADAAAGAGHAAEGRPRSTTSRSGATRG